jgi:hypothetical protein
MEPKIAGVRVHAHLPGYLAAPPEGGYTDSRRNGTKFSGTLARGRLLAAGRGSRSGETPAVPEVGPGGGRWLNSGF